MKNSIRRSDLKLVGPSVMALMMTLSLAVGAKADTGKRPFQTYVTQGYTEVANYAAFQMGNKGVAKHFQNKAQLAQSGGRVDPENPANFTSRWGVDIAKARNLLIEVLSSDQLKQNPEMAAIALVNFDCFVAGVGQDGKLCLDAFATALAALRPTITNATPQSNGKDQFDSARSFAPPDRGRSSGQSDEAEDNPGDNPPIGIGIGSGDDTGNGTVVGIAVGAGDRSGIGGLVGASVLSGNQSGIGGLVGASVLSGNQSGIGGLAGASVLSGNQSGVGGLVGASVLSGNQSGHGGLVGISALSGENSGKGGVAGVSVLSGPADDQEIAKIDTNSIHGSLSATKDVTATAARESIANVGGSLHSLNQTFDTAVIGIETGENSVLGRTTNDILGALGARSSGGSPSSSQAGSDGSTGGSSGSSSGSGSNSSGSSSASNGGVGGAAGSVGGAVGGAIDSIGGTVGGIGEGLGGLGDGLGGLGGALGGN